MSSFMPLTETQSMIFDITKLHQKYWRTFCDVYYVHLGFETEEVHSYEQKYETFCRRKSVSEEKDYEEKSSYGTDSFEFGNTADSVQSRY